ncbi:tetratricopeptide repeat protein [Gluconobacter morbifer]|uniref:Uncharacterized protein n=1 Tax=Gluconobacter morbifer G707 TaxID=1088869 RepID=G6XGG3_9PROT|nr:tetratricopeptide repeat protein [Gluconobacter morbifer]EHH69271.1 hypothetical protein GMO_05780 [Gluconobacter morbifer G707]
MKPSDPSDLIRQAFAFFAAGASDRAEGLFRGILKDHPGQPDAMHGMACLARARGQNATAIALTGRALQDRTLSADRSGPMHVTLGLALVAEKHVEAGRAALSVAVALQPDSPQALAALGEVLWLLGRREEARQTLEKAVALSPADVSLQTRLGELYLEDGLSAAALSHFRAVATRRPHDGAALANLGAVLFELNELTEARLILQRACRSGAVTPETLNSLGLVDMAMGHLGAARSALEQALARRPDDGRLAGSLGTLLMDMGEEDRAEQVFAAIMSRENGIEAIRARFNRATVLLGQGRFAEGWKDFESRRVLLGHRDVAPLWDGSCGSGPVAVTAEQGLGDMLQFLRFLPEAARRRPLRLRFAAASLTTFMPELTKDRLLPSKGPVDAEISLLSLPFVLGMTEAPSTLPYLTVPVCPEPDLVGLAWAGNPSYRFDRRRSLRPEWLAPLLETKGVRFLSLQREHALTGMEKAPLDTLDDLARAVARCSLVLSVDTLAAHMAGAIGRPLWLLNRPGGDWRWKDVPWYENVRQFRPERDGPPEKTWPVTLDRVAAELRQWVQSRVEGA